MEKTGVVSMQRKFFSGIFLTIFAILLVQAVSAQKRSLTWSDEFNGNANATPDPTKWSYDLGVGFDGGWGNQELEYYTDRPENAYLDGSGNLVIKAIKENFTGANNVTRSYTSARLVTRGKFTPTYGRIEARIKIPYGQGIWPAFWMLGANIDTPGVGWPGCGEIDILENIGREPSIVHGTLHGPGYSGANGLSAAYSLTNGQRFADDFHIYAVEWDIREIRFYVDGNLYKTQTTKDIPANGSWVFDHPHYLILNLAVGGGWPGFPDATTIFPQMMFVDYVRVYAPKNSTTRGTTRR